MRSAALLALLGATLLATPAFAQTIVPWIFASIRIGVGLALTGSVVGELLESNRGLGWYVERSAGQIDIVGVFTSLVVLMIVGMLLNEMVKLVERRFLRNRY